MEQSEQLNVLEQCRQGDLSGFGRLYDFYIKKIYSFIYFKTHHKETAEDLTSKTFLKALNGISSFSSMQGSFSSWLYAIARNTVIDHYRTKKIEADIDDIWDLAGDEDVMRDLDAAQKIRIVEQYLAKLPARQREIVVMRVWQEMSYQEIAEALGQSEASCKMMYSRTMKVLRAEMPLAVFIAMVIGVMKI